MRPPIIGGYMFLIFFMFTMAWQIDLLNGRRFAYILSGFGFESRYSHLK